MKITVVDRATGKPFEEKVLGEEAIRWIYENPVGRFVTDRILVRKWLSQAYGHYQSSRYSRKAIDPFVKDFSITMDEFEPGPYSSFNDFFIRKFKPGRRPFAEGPRLPAFAEGRYLTFENVTRETPLPIKGATLNVQGLLGKSEWTSVFENGPGTIARLCPVDYHRFHYPDDGEILDRYRLEGPLHSVSPIALRKHGRILFENERVVTILKTKNFKRLAMIEVGALCVGLIQQTHVQKTFARGEEKGYFLFGGSTVILLGEPGSFRFDQDLLQNTARGLETYITLGSAIGSSL